MGCTREELYYLHDISENAEKVLNKMLRLYTGLFMDYVYIREVEIATSIKESEHTVYDALLELSRRKIISYIPFSDLPMIYFPTAREETDCILIGKTIYEERRQTLSERTEAMIEYAFTNGSCRVRRMLAYFGETDSADCRKCDICRARRSAAGRTGNESPEKRMSLVLDYLKATPSGATLRMIEHHCGESRITAEVLTFLCNEGYLSFENELYQIAR
jgi:ATP-dependent DNA helicase RecQ